MSEKNKALPDTGRSARNTRRANGVPVIWRLFSRKSLALTCALALTAVGTLSVRAETPDAMAIVDGTTTLDVLISDAVATDLMQPITMGDGSVDLVYAGAPECRFCQAFMQEQYADLVAFAEEAGLDFSYLPLAQTPLGLSIAAIEICAAPASTLSAPDRIAAAYRGIEPLWKITEKAQEMATSGASPARVSSTHTIGVMAVHSMMKTGEALDAECYRQTSMGLASQMDQAVRAFEIEGTPSFFINGPDGVLRLTGAEDIPALKEALRR